ncbi:hypothetical protein EBS43_05005 [bacterium]|jgi:hypothetical protein|nr:hypothetical protein [bacterium]
MKVSNKILVTALALSYALPGVAPAFAHTHTVEVVEHYDYHHHHNHYHGSDPADAAATGFLAGSTGATAALFFSASISRKVGAAPELIKDQAAAYFVSNEDSVLLHSAMEEFRNLLRAQGSDADSLSYDELVELYLDTVH